IRSIYLHPRVNKAARVLVPYRARRALLSAVRRIGRADPEPDSRDEKLRALCRPDVERLAALIGRDLSHWL
ncbi:MAG: hypothetical protein WBV61_07540, partial [Rhodanobacteraceae bacterium]